MGRPRKEIRVGIRSGCGAMRAKDDGKEFPRIKIAVVSGGKRPMLWLGVGPYDGIAWITGADTLRRLRDALTAMLASEGGGK